MLTYKYTARDSKTGQKVTAEVQAESEQAAAKLIQQEGLTPISIKAKDTDSSILKRFRSHIGTKDKILFSRQMSTLINAGLPLVQSLNNVNRQTQNKAFASVIGEVIADIEAGSSFSAALGRHPRVFNQMYISLVAAGEASGTLDKALERVANQQEKDAELISKVRGAMVYPVIVLVVMVGVVTFMLTSVLPQVQELYKGLKGVSLPITTRILLALSNFMIKYWWIIVILLGFMIFFGSRWMRTLGGKTVVDRFKLRVPPMNRLFLKMYMARFCRTGTTLVASGVPLLQILNITAKSINNIHVEKSILVAAEKVKGGKALSESLAGDRNFLTLVPDMLKIGEQSGSLEAMMEKTAVYFEKEVDDEIKAISTIIEPALMIVLGIVALVIVSAILLPIYSLVGKNAIR